MVQTVNVKVLSNIFDKIPTRMNVGLLLFMACFISYMLRVNFSIIIIKMSADTNTTTTIQINSSLIAASDLLSTNETDVVYRSSNYDHDEQFNWNKKAQGLLLSAYFYGYLFPNLIGGSLAGMFGGRKVVFFTMLISSIITALSPFAANDNFIFMFIMRFILGLMGGFLYPALHQIISKWAPYEEKGKFVSMLMGGVFGTVISWPLTGYITEHFGWRYAFYAPAILSLLVSFLWLYFVHDSPNVHPRISKAEKELIEKSLGATNNDKKKHWPPMNQVFKSLPFYALIFLHFGGTFGLFFLLTAAPKFMSEVLKFKLTEAGILSSLPYLARLIAGYIFGSIGDTLRHKKILGTTAIRKSFCIFSHIIPGLFLLLLCMIGYDPYICVAVITLSLGFNGAATMTNLQNSQDLAPNFAGHLYGIINFVATTSGFISPLIVAYFTQERSTMDEWQWIFIIGAFVYILPGLFFIAFGSGEVQKWNEGQSDSKSDEKNQP